MGELNVLKCGLGTKGTKEDGGAFRCEEGHSITGPPWAGLCSFVRASMKLLMSHPLWPGSFHRLVMHDTEHRGNNTRPNPTPHDR